MFELSLRPFCDFDLDFGLSFDVSFLLDSVGSWTLLHPVPHGFIIHSQDVDEEVDDGELDSDGCLRGEHEDVHVDAYPKPPCRKTYPNINRVLESTVKA